jgi:hypothetical protein
MPKFHLIVSLCLALIMIGSATFIRFFTSESQNPELIAIANEIKGAASEDYSDWQEESGGTAAINNEVNQTELAGKQLFAEYFSLTSQNQGSSANLLNLAQKYAQNLSGNNISARQITLQQITLISDSKESLLAYNSSFNALRSKYGALVSSASKGKDLTDIEGKDFSDFMKSISEMYVSYANELVSQKAPASVSQNHLELINNYFETAAAARVISNIAVDPLAAYNAMNVYAQNTDQETTLLLNIQVAVLSAGSYLGNDI